MKNKDLHTLIEIEYNYKDSKSILFKFILILGLLIPLLSTFYISLLSFIFFKNQILTISTTILFLILIYFAYIILFKIKIICKLTSNLSLTVV